MNIQKRQLGKTYVTQSFQWGLYTPNGHRLLCSDGVIRAARLAQTADTFFSVPASIQVKGKHVTGYMTTEESDTGTVYAFRHHNGQDDKLPAWPDRWTAEHDAMIQFATSQETAA